MRDCPYCSHDERCALHLGAPLTIVIKGQPVTKGRPRWGKGGRPFTPKRTRDYEELVAWHCRAMRSKVTGPVHVHIHLVSGTSLRGDPDNYAKAILDGAVKGELIDDDNAATVRTLHVTQALCLDPAESRVELTVTAA